MKLLLKTLLLLIVIFISILVSIFLCYNRPTYEIPGNKIEFEIKKGDSAYQIANRLYYKGYIRSKNLFKIIIKLTQMNKNIKSGWVILTPNSTTFNIIQTIYSGNFITISFTIPEGYNIKQIKELLVKKNILDETELNEFFSQPDYLKEIGLAEYQSAEGFLFPSTYKFYKGVASKTLFSTMVELYFEKLKLIAPEYKKMSYKELYEKSILASIIEKEVKNQNESLIVSGIFYNRLKKRIKIQSCATIQYILEKPKEHLLLSDLLIDHPYNTYIYYGLPPGPICNPGYLALNAAFHPAKHDYLYFVVKDPIKGTHHFSETYKEHLIAQRKYKHLKGLY